MSGGKIGVVDVGGGFRGIYAAGVLDWCMDNGIGFDLGIGVSAGSANLISYCAGQRGRNYRFYAEYGMRKEYASIGNFLRKRSFVDMDYVYGTLNNSDGESPLDYAAAMASPTAYYAVATDAETGKAKYFDKSDVSQDDYSVCKASSAIPFVCHPYPVGNTLYYDGALSDPVPIRKAFELGCERVVLLLTRPEDTIRTPAKDLRLARCIRKKYPLAAQGKAQAILAVNEATAEGLKLLNQAAPTEPIVQLKALDAFTAAANGQATKIIIPSEIQGIAGLATAFKECLTDPEKK